MNFISLAYIQSTKLLDFFNNLRKNHGKIAFLARSAKVAERAIYFTLCNLARSAKWPTALYVLPSVISFFFFFFYLSFLTTISQRQIISRSAEPIFAILRRMKAFWV